MYITNSSLILWILLSPIKNMTNNSYPNIKSLMVSDLSHRIHFEILKECRKNFIIIALTCFAGIKGKINFLQMEGE